MADTPETTTSTDFIRQAVADDLDSGRFEAVRTRFPPEPNGYLHIGHAKALCIDFGIARDFGGQCNLRFDDTNPVKEDIEYVDSIQEDIHWLGFDWDDRLFYASDYFEQIYEWAELLIQKGIIRRETEKFLWGLEDGEAVEGWHGKQLGQHLAGFNIKPRLASDSIFPRIAGGVFYK